MRGKLGGFFPEHISACGSGDPGVTLALGVLYSSGPHIFRSTNQPARERFEGPEIDQEEAVAAQRVTTGIARGNEAARWQRCPE